MSAVASDGRALPVRTIQVFGGPDAAGNATGVVLADAPLPAGVAQRLAQDLGYPDTAIVARDPETGGMRCDSFSPTEPLAFCVQTLLAAALVLQGDGPQEEAATRLQVGSRVIEVVQDAARYGDEGRRFWVHMSRSDVEPFAAASVHSIIEGANTAVLVDSGRRRVFVPTDDAATLATFDPSPASVRRFCTRENVHGLCLYFIPALGRAMLRVFTTSLGGQEDVATGGAVAGLGACLERDFPLDEWRVEQGQGPRHRRGLLFLRQARGETHVGGSARPVMIGHLVLSG